MIAILIVHPSSLPLSALWFSLPGWLQMGLTLAGLGVSAWISGVLPKHPRMQKVVTAFALASMLALSMVSASHQSRIVRHSIAYNWPPPCDGWWSYVDFTCWFAR